MVSYFTGLIGSVSTAITMALHPEKNGTSLFIGTDDDFLHWESIKLDPIEHFVSTVAVIEICSSPIVKIVLSVNFAGSSSKDFVNDLFTERIKTAENCLNSNLMRDYIS